MRFPDDDGLPLWVFILVILLTTAAIAVVISVLWLRYAKRSSRRKILSSDLSEQPLRQVSVRKGQLVRTSWNTSLTGPNFGSEENRQQSPRPTRQWPERTYSGEYSGNDQQSFTRDSMLFNTQSLNFLDEPPRRSWSDSPGTQSNVGWRDSVNGSINEEGLRRSYVFDWALFTHGLEKAHLKPKPLTIEPPSIDSPAPLSPITPLTLPRTPHYAASCTTTLPSPPQHPALPPRPIELHRESIYRVKLGSMRQPKQRKSTMLDAPLVSHHRVRSQSSERPSSVASSASFLQAWSDVYHEWLVLPKTPSSSRSAKSYLPTSYRLDVTSIADTNSEADEGYQADMSLPSSASTMVTDDRSLVLPIRSSGTLSALKIRKASRSEFEGTKQTRHDERSWLVDH